jgi:ribose 1,5-bisphosphokinase
MTGAFVCVVGPSGAGKDTLIRGAQTLLAGDPRFVFPRRIVTRAASAFEDHDVVLPDAFERAAADGAFALSWTAHGLGYAIPADVLAALAKGAVVTCNLSRRAVAEARSRLAGVAVVHVTAPRAVLAARLGARGRECPAEIEARLDRDPGAEDLAPDCVIVNDGSAELATRKLVDVLRGLSERPLAGVDTAIER